MTVRGALAICLAVCMAGLAAGRTAAQSTPDLYFLAIGSGAIRDTSGVSLPEAENSARHVALALQRSGARHGILLTSKGTGNFVTRDDIYDAIFDLKSKIREDRSEAPRILLYFMGHGVGDPIVSTLYMLPGDIEDQRTTLRQSTALSLIHQSVYNFDLIATLVFFRTPEAYRKFDEFIPSDFMIDPNRPGDSVRTMLMQIRAMLQSGGRLRDRLKSREWTVENTFGGAPAVPFVLILDNCYQSIEQDTVQQAPIVGRLMSRWLAELSDSGLVYYASRPGELAWPVIVTDDLPHGPLAGEKVGPLALRLLDTLSVYSQGAPLSVFRESFEGSPVQIKSSFAERAAGAGPSRPAPNPFSPQPQAFDTELFAAPFFRAASGNTLDTRLGSAGD